MREMKLTIKTNKKKTEEIIRDGLSKGLSHEEITSQVIENCIEIAGPPKVGSRLIPKTKRMINKDGVRMEKK